ncbi:MAG: hypothetical protein HY748_15320 [Elusimicrobia bacterium]|nr:hypothetical protein [Elusimicrobiota bacterium]
MEPWGGEEDGGETSPELSNFIGGLIMVLIFTVGNYFLYKYTGYIIIPTFRR